MTADPHLHDGHPDRLLVICAHPADADRAIGGSVARWVGMGTRAHLVCGTSGDAGSDDTATDPLELAGRREAEQRAAAAHIGYEDVTFLHRPEGALINDLALREQLVRIIRTFRPDALAAPDPSVIFGTDRAVQHVDHREVGMAAVDAAYPAARAAMAFPHLARSEGLAPHEVRRLYLFEAGEPTAFVDVGSTIAVKLDALREHHSQVDRLLEFEERVRDASRQAGEQVGVDAAEAFSIVDLA